MIKTIGENIIEWKKLYILININVNFFSMEISFYIAQWLKQISIIGFLFLF